MNNKKLLQLLALSSAALLIATASSASAEPGDAPATCGDLVVTGDEVCDGQIGCGDDCLPLENWVCEEAAAIVICTPELGWDCSETEPYLCVTVCGDGIVAGAETCDDENGVDGDGCTANCTIEEGYACEGSPSVCTEAAVEAPVCGDGIVTEDEACDDGNTVDGDGCTANCTIEEGYACEGSPSVCTITDAPSTPAVCGDGIVQGDEDCDGDLGCAADCTWLTAATGGRIGSCSTGLGEGAGGALAMLALGVGLIANRRRKNAA